MDEFTVELVVPELDELLDELISELAALYEPGFVLKDIEDPLLVATIVPHSSVR